MTTRLRFSQRYTRRRLEERMDSQIRIHRMGPPDLDPLTGAVTPSNEGVVYEGKARLWQATSGGPVGMGDGASLDTRVFMATIPYNVEGIRVDDIVEILASGSDSDMVGRTAQIGEVTGGGLLHGARNLRLTGLYESDSWLP